MGNKTKIAIWIIGITEILLAAALVFGGVFIYRKLTDIENAVDKVQSQMENGLEESRKKESGDSDSGKTDVESTEESSGENSEKNETEDDGLIADNNDIYEPEFDADSIPDTYTEGEETYQLGSYTFYGYENGRDLWKADFGHDRKQDAFTGYIDADSGEMLDVAKLAKKVGYEHEYYALGKEKFDADGHVLYEYVYAADDNIEDVDPNYGYEYDYDDTGKRTEYRYYYNTYENGYVLRSRNVYHYNDQGKQAGYEVYDGEDELTKICQYKYNSKDRRRIRVERDGEGNISGTVWYYYDLNGHTSKTVAKNKLYIYINDEDGNTILRVVYEKP